MTFYVTHPVGTELVASPVAHVCYPALGKQSQDQSSNWLDLHQELAARLGYMKLWFKKRRMEE